MTWKEITDIFGNSDSRAGRLALEIDIKYIAADYRDVFGVFKTTFDVYHTDADNIEDPVSWTNRKFSGKNLCSIQKEYDPNENFHSTYVFRNLYRVISETDSWDSAIRDVRIIKLFVGYKRKILAELKRNYRDVRLQDLFEVICEFTDLILRKQKDGRNG